MLFILKKPHYRLIFATALVMLSGWIISASYLYLVTDSIAKNEAQITARHTARQAAITIQPYLLAEDIISLNFYLNNLTEARLVNGVAIYNKQSKLIARAGENHGTEQQVILGNQQTPTGTLKLYSNHEAQKNMLSGLLWQVSILSLITLLATLVTLWLALKPLKISSDEPEDTEKQSDALTAENATQAVTEAHDEEESTQDKASDSFTQTLAATLEDTPDKIPPLLEVDSSNNPGATVSDKALDENNSDTLKTHQYDDSSSDETLNDDELVNLLRPDTTQRMPHFTPSPMQPDDDDGQPRQQQREATYELEEHQQSTPQAAPASAKPNPLRAHERTEEQLDLYSLDHQLELSLQPQDAAYLFYIDATTGHADYVEPEEHNYLLKTYEKLIKKVAAIYGGAVSIDASGDMQLFFDDQDEEDGHGVHALCAAKLFTLLYRAFNQARIKSFKPVLNLHMAIVRGNREKFNLIKEEALFLTRTTQSNELISHTALTEARQLKATLLSSADVRREDEDKVLILSLTASYQALLNKQATHLLSKPVTETTADH